MRGELTTPPKLKNPKLPKVISDIVMKAMAPELTDRYQRASELLDAVLSARAATMARRPWRPAGANPPGLTGEMQDIQARLKAREAPQAGFCWNCSKPLPARAEACPFCRERQ
jgi:hypothetical protein